MRPSSIIVRDLENRWESLPLALQAIARWSGVELHFRTINAALGSSFAITAPEDRDVSPAWWMTFGRESFLPQTAEFFGLELEPLPEPKRFESRSDSSEELEFYNAELKPRISQALSDGRPVLCWRGWPDYHSFLWGVITDFDDGPLGFRGTTMWAHGGQLPLATPPRRSYVVTDIHPSQPSKDVVLKFAIRHIAAMVHGALPPDLGVVSGLAAYDRWLDWLMTTPINKPESRGGHSAHYQLARFVTHARESAGRFIEHYKDGLHDDIRLYLEAMHADCKGAIGALSTSRDLKAVEVLYGCEDGREALAAGVRAARDFLIAQIKTVDHMVGALGPA
jgi:hypothetical protein